MATATAPAVSRGRCGDTAADACVVKGGGDAAAALNHPQVKLSQHDGVGASEVLRTTDNLIFISFIRMSNVQIRLLLQEPRRFTGQMSPCAHMHI